MVFVIIPIHSNSKVLDLNQYLGKWKVTGEKGQKGHIIFSLDKDSLVFSYKSKETKGKWVKSKEKYFSKPVISSDNEISFESTVTIDYDTTEVREDDTYKYIYFIKWSYINNKMSTMEIGRSQTPVQVNDHVPYTRPIISSKFSTITR